MGGSGDDASGAGAGAGSSAGGDDAAGEAQAAADAVAADPNSTPEEVATAQAKADEAQTEADATDAGAADTDPSCDLSRGDNVYTGCGYVYQSLNDANTQCGSVSPTPFIWDGTSSIIIQVCRLGYSNGSTESVE